MPVTTWVPMFLFVILFGLSMDYEVFLLSRIREDYDTTGDNAASVARGLAKHGPGDHRRSGDHGGGVPVASCSARTSAVKQIGLGLAVAVLIDATIVRMVLVPAVMELLGRANWWLPARLARILPKAPPSEDEPPAEVGFALVRAVVPGRGLLRDSARRR